MCMFQFSNEVKLEPSSINAYIRIYKTFPRASFSSLGLSSTTSFFKASYFWIGIAFSCNFFVIAPPSGALFLLWKPPYRCRQGWKVSYVHIFFSCMHHDLVFMDKETLPCVNSHHITKPNYDRFISTFAMKLINWKNQFLVCRQM
jgi:hypothetical protein